MVSNGKIVIPGMIFGNVFLTVQPSRGWDAVEDYHNPYLPPSHQYIAFYNWIEKVFGANAMERFQLRALQRIGMPVDASENLSVVNYPTEFIYHPDSTTPQFATWADYLNWYKSSGHYKPGKAWND